MLVLKGNAWKKSVVVNKMNFQPIIANLSLLLQPYLHNPCIAEPTSLKLTLSSHLRGRCY